MCFRKSALHWTIKEMVRKLILMFFVTSFQLEAKYKYIQISEELVYIVLNQLLLNGYL